MSMLDPSLSKDLGRASGADGDPLPPGQVWAVGPCQGETGAGLYRIEIAAGPGSGAKILNHPVPPAFRESVKVGEQNLYARAKEFKALLGIDSRAWQAASATVPKRRSAKLPTVRLKGLR